jgi:hypothetical protein
LTPDTRHPTPSSSRSCTHCNPTRTSQLEQQEEDHRSNKKGILEAEDRSQKPGEKRLVLAESVCVSRAVERRAPEESVRSSNDGHSSSTTNTSSTEVLMLEKPYQAGGIRCSVSRFDSRSDNGMVPHPKKAFFLETTTPFKARLGGQYQYQYQYQSNNKHSSTEYDNESSGRLVVCGFRILWEFALANAEEGGRIQQ